MKLLAFLACLYERTGRAIALPPALRRRKQNVKVFTFYLKFGWLVVLGLTAL